MSIKSSIAKLLWHSGLCRGKRGKTVYKWMNKVGQAPDFPFEEDFYGLRYQGNLQNNIEFSIYYYGAFEKPLLHFLRDAATALPGHETVFFDIGANIGQHSLFLSQHVTQVHAFEPYQLVRDRLTHHIDLNAIENIEVHPLGLSNEDSQLPFFAPTGSNQGIGSFDQSTTSKGNKEIGKLKIVKGDNYLSVLGIQRVNLIKMDVEGFEKPALAGINEILRRNRPVVVCEISYQGSLAFRNMAELAAAFPDNYEFFTFNTRKEDGSKARKRGARAKRSGEYQLIPFHFDANAGQDDIVACPNDLAAIIPMSNV